MYGNKNVVLIYSLSGGLITRLLMSLTSFLLSETENLALSKPSFEKLFEK